MNLQESIKRILRENKLYATPQQLVKNLPDELKNLLFKQWGAKQNPEWHPEGNTLKHILVVLKRAYHHYPDDPNMIMAALFHDLGKMDTYSINPKTNQPTAYGHEDRSTDYVEQFKDWVESFEGTDVDEIKYLVKNHMKVKPRTWDQMKDKKKEPIKSHPAFDKLMGFTDKLDGGGVDLKESIRRILREELTSSVRRRINFNDIQRIIDNRKIEKFLKNQDIEKSVQNTIHSVMYDVMPDGFEDDDTEYYKVWDEIKQYLRNNYTEQLIQYFEKRQRDVDNEKNPLGIKYIFVKHDKPYENSGWRGFAEGFNSFDDMITKYGNWVDVDWDEIKKKLDNINDYPVRTYANTMNSRPLRISSIGDKGNGWGYNFSIIKQIPKDNVDKVKDIQTEGELTEKCWKGYTQKGMKTMFGKRYPNCVKKTK